MRAISTPIHVIWGGARSRLGSPRKLRDKYPLRRHKPPQYPPRSPRDRPGSACRGGCRETTTPAPPGPSARADARCGRSPDGARDVPGPPGGKPSGRSPGAGGAWRRTGRPRRGARRSPGRRAGTVGRWTPGNRAGGGVVGAGMARMGVWIRRFLGRPGDVDIGPYRRLVAEAGALADRAGRVTDLRSALASAPPATAEFCALMREAAHRALGLRPHDVQLIGALALLDGHVAEMATGEGKTLVGAIAAAGYALRGERVHVVSVNDYLARRDAEWMAPLYAAVGLTAGWIAATWSPGERGEADGRDVTYAAVSELGFDVLRDRFVTDPADLVVPAPQVAIVDEADSVLVDEARVPLVLAGSAAPGTA